jgi:hypothetical protein
VTVERGLHSGEGQGVWSPIPDVVKSTDGSTLFTRGVMMAGQQIFLGNGLMEYGSIFGHPYLGPDLTINGGATLGRIRSLATVNLKGFLHFGGMGFPYADWPDPNSMIPRRRATATA